MLSRTCRYFYIVNKIDKYRLCILCYSKKTTELTDCGIQFFWVDTKYPNYFENKLVYVLIKVKTILVLQHLTFSATTHFLTITT